MRHEGTKPVLKRITFEVVPQSSALTLKLAEIPAERGSNQDMETSGEYEIISVRDDCQRGGGVK